MSDNQRYKRLESIRLNKIKKEYQEKGYEVIINPSDEDLPLFLKNYRPDAIAISENDNVIIEIKSEQTMEDSKNLNEIAEKIEKQGKKWRLEFVMTNPKKKFIYQNEILNKNDIDKRINEISFLIDNNILTSAYLLSWATLHAIMRYKLIKNKKIYDYNSMKLVKNLYSYGYLNRIDYNFLIKASKTRNSIAHGKTVDELSLSDVNRLLTIIKKLFYSEK